MPAASGPATAAFERLMARFSAGLRISAAAAGIFGAWLGLAAPAVPAMVALATGTLLAWAIVYATVLPRRGWTRWAVAGDLAVIALLCLAHRWVVPAAALAGWSTWLAVVASSALIVAALSKYPVLGLTGVVAVPAAYAVGSRLAGLPVPGLVVLLALQGLGAALLFRALRRQARAADRGIADQEAQQREEVVRAGRRAEERWHHRLLHDSVSATLTVVAGGGATNSPTLRAQADRDLAVVESLQRPATVPDTVAPASDPVPLAARLGPVLAAQPGLRVEGTVGDALVPAPVAAALAGAVGEALANTARHAGVNRLRLRTWAERGGVRVELVDGGRGFDPGRVPAHRRGLRESIRARLAEVGGAADVESRPGAGTRVLLRWPAEPETPPADPRDSRVGELVARRYQRAFEVAVVCVIGARHLANLVAMLTDRTAYRSLALGLLAWLALAAIAAAGSVLLLRGENADRRTAWPLAAAVLLASAAATASVGTGAELTTANWILGSAGAFGLLILLRRPIGELALLIALNAGFTLALLAHDGKIGRVTVVQCLLQVWALAAVQGGIALTFRALERTAQRAAAAARQQAEVRDRGQVAQALHRSRLERYQTVRRSVVPLLSGLSTGALDPAALDTRRRCAVEASRLRRLFAETDDVPDPLLHELRACADLAYSRGVLVDMQVVGRLPELPRPVRRALTEAPLHALAAAEREARVTVLGRSGEVAVSVLSDAVAGDPAELEHPLDATVTVTVQTSPDLQWIEARWQSTQPPAATPAPPTPRTSWNPQTALLP